MANINNSVRNEMNEQSPEFRAHNFKEVALGFDDETAYEEACRCLDCKNRSLAERVVLSE